MNYRGIPTLSFSTTFEVKFSMVFDVCPQWEGCFRNAEIGLALVE
jgi:hypothetical protein